MTIDDGKTRQSWQQLIIDVSEDASLLVQQALLELGALGLEIDDDETKSLGFKIDDDEMRMISEKPFIPTYKAHIVATFTHEAGLQDRVEQKLSALLETYESKWNELPDGDWVNNFQNLWKSFTLGHNIWIVPSWEVDQFQVLEKNAIVLHMDPGMAFGTGHHETTILCARAIFEFLNDKPSLSVLHVLDVGTGTGILAMIAAKMGVGQVIGTDNDHEAVRVAIENCQHNHLVGKINICDRSPNFMGSYFDLVVANILANPLIQMSQQIIESIVPGGKLFLSGVLQTQEPSVRETYTQHGLIHQKTIFFNEWVLIDFQKPFFL
jgi:ribosomal protein L11 methyltransferase